MDIGIIIVVGIFVVLPAAITINNLLTERRMKQRAEQLIALDRIARQVDAGVNHFSIGPMIKAYRESDGRGPFKQVWKVPISYHPNDGTGSVGTTPEMRLDGSDDIRAIEDDMVKAIRLHREYKGT